MNISRLRAHLPSPALIVSCVALFSALGGGAYAATSITHTVTPVHWLNAATVNSWTLYASGYAPAGYAKDNNNVVHLRGGISGGSSGSTAFTLPVGYRPNHYLFLPIYTVSGSVGSVEITPAGAVEPFGSSASSYTGLDGISFPAGE